MYDDDSFYQTAAISKSLGLHLETLNIHEATVESVLNQNLGMASFEGVLVHAVASSAFWEHLRGEIPKWAIPNKQQRTDRE